MPAPKSYCVKLHDGGSDRQVEGCIEWITAQPLPLGAVENSGLSKRCSLKQPSRTLLLINDKKASFVVDIENAGLVEELCAQYVDIFEMTVLRREKNR